MSKFLMICIVTSCLLGAGAMVVWKQNYSEKKQNPDAQTQVSRPKLRHPSKRKTSTSNKWKQLTNDSLPRKTRLDLARQIDQNISPAEIDTLFTALHHQPAAQNKETWWVIMNEIMEQMRRKGVAPDRLSKEFIALIEDSSQPEVVRDYAVQHLSLWISPSGNAPSEPSTEMIDQALLAIADTVTDASIAHTSIPGTAIMALTTASMRLVPETSSPIWEKLNSAMTSMLKGEINVPLSTQTTIIQAAAMRGSEAHLPLVQSMARNEKIDPSMRLSSIAALGIYRSEPDREYLISIAQGRTRYRYAAQSALKKLQN